MWYGTVLAANFIRGQVRSTYNALLLQNGAWLYWVTFVDWLNGYWDTILASPQIYRSELELRWVWEQLVYTRKNCLGGALDVQS